MATRFTKKANPDYSWLVLSCLVRTSDLPKILEAVYASAPDRK